MGEATSGKDQMSELKGLLSSNPFLATLLGIASLILAGIPLFSGFIPKLALLQVAAERASPIAIFVILASGFMAMAGIWLRTSLGEPTIDNHATTGSVELCISSGILFVLAVSDPKPETIGTVILLGTFLLMTVPLSAAIITRIAWRRGHIPVSDEGKNILADTNEERRKSL